MTDEQKAEKGEAHATGKMMDPSDIADGVLFLLKNDSMCGEILTVDGGMSITTIAS